MDVAEIIGQFQSLAGQYPYIALALLMFLIGALVRGKAALIFYALGGLALLKSFGLVDTFFSFLKEVPNMLKEAFGSLGGV
ncbi:t26-9p [Thermococcus aciditolerans]|uniref:T26-9p n=1 Tax=Thermococcus aciditolerans TaxID=2598455 RepID=A0A5C0SJ59_9EURY|nr:t26-9p [Thermococcus aciditolerans]QEK14565.1 t26-9p [Thermococcus aciditolerans]